MKLRHKFGLLAFLYVITLAANFAMCSWCLLMYYQSFLEQRASESVQFGEAQAELEGPWPQGPSAGAGDPEPPPAGSSYQPPVHETYVLQILAVNTLCGLAVGLLGLRLVRGWVIRPIASLHDAVVKIGSGRLSHRIAALGSDELGELAGEVNAMAASIVTMQGQLIEHERRQVASQALRCIVHNIRSPLTGIRWLAEAIGMRTDLDARTTQTQSRIVEVVDEVLTWLQGFRESLAAMSMQVREVAASTVIKTAVDQCAQAAERRRVSVEVRHASDVSRVRIEQAQFTSALQILLSAAIAGTPAGQVIRLGVERPSQLPGYWQVVIECGGVSTAEPAGDRRHRISRDDLAMAERVVRLHGGRLEWEDGAARVCRCLMIMPG